MRRIVLALLLVAAGVAPSSVAVAQPAPQVCTTPKTVPVAAVARTAALSSLHVTGTATFDGHVQINGNAASGTDTLTVKADGQHNAVLVTDPNGAPIFGVGSYGGASVFGDSFRIHGSDIFNADLTLWLDGSLTIDQRAGGPSLFGGSADPRVSPPASVHGFHAGDRYLQTSAPFDTYVYDGADWLVK